MSSYAWLEKLIPVYTRNEFAKIDWNPCAIEYEEMKEVILNNASRRLKDTKEKYEEIIKISEFYENRVKRDYKNSYIMRIDEFVSKEWKGKKEIKYGIWGITQSSDEVYNWISQNYPNAVLSVVIDEFRDIEFKGIKAVKSEEIQKYRDCYFLQQEIRLALQHKRNLRNWDLRIDFVQYMENFIKMYNKELY